jgi:HEAT repeat protein
MALLSFQEGIGFVPFAGMGYTAIRAIVKDDSSPVRAAAARVLADDRDPDIDDALVQVAIGDKRQLVRTTALDALAPRGNLKVVDREIYCRDRDCAPERCRRSPESQEEVVRAGLLSPSLFLL